jgi:uncharacterized protein (DUF1684 family)
MATTSASDHRREVEAWRSARLAKLTSPDGWLAVVALEWLQDGANPVVLPGREAPAGTIEVDVGVATFHPAEGEPFTKDGTPITGSVELLDDSRGDPTVLRRGPVSFHVIRRYGTLALRVRDGESPAVRSFHEIEHYSVDLRWRIKARFEPYEEGRTAEVGTVLGTPEIYSAPGAAAFAIGGEPYRLDVFLEDGESDLFVVFGDETNQSETFGGGRYLYTPQAGPDGIVVLDFNRAYNPPCAFTAHVTCPLPLPQNRLPVRVEAGEKRYNGAG